MDRFYDGRTARAHPITIDTDDHGIAIRDRETGRMLAHWPIAGLSVSDSNAVNGEMTFRHSSVEGGRLVLTPHPQRDGLLERAAHLKHWRRHERWRLGKAVTLLTAAALAIGIGGYFALPYLAVALIDLMPLSWDKKLGDGVRDTVLETLATCKGEAGQAAIDRLGQRLLPPEIAELPLTIDVVRLNQVNAFALPGNHVVVFSGLIEKADAPEMLAGVLAHEIGHLEMRHPTRGVIEQLGLGVAASVLLGNEAMANLGQLMAALSYTRDMEREADERAITLLHRADIRADGLARFFNSLKTEEKDEKLHIPVFLSSHPGLDERAEATRQDTSGGAAMPDGEWQALKAMCGGT